MKIDDRFIVWIKSKYKKKGIDWSKSDSIIWSFWAYVFPYLAWIPLLFYLLKKLMIDYLLVHKGFETTVVYITIILIIRPTLMEALSKIMKFKEEIKKNEL